MSKSRYEKSIDARDEAVYRFVKFMTNKSAADADLDGVKCNRLLDELDPRNERPPTMEECHVH